jgi:hypothetical protein
MFDSDFDRDNRSLVGISVSAVSLLLLACLAGFCLMFFGMAYVGALLDGDLNSIGRGVGAGFITFGGYALCIVTFWAWKALYKERAWALWIARTWAVLLLVLGSSDLYRLHRPHTPTADEYFGILYDPVLIIGGAVWLLYLWLPKVRARFGAH